MAGTRKLQAFIFISCILFRKGNVTHDNSKKKIQKFESYTMKSALPGPLVSLYKFI